MDARRDNVIDEYHGWRVADPYRWLEDAKSAETQQWIAAQNDATQSFVGGPLRDSLQERLTEIWNYTKYGVPEEAGGRYFYTRQEGLQNQPVLCMQQGLDAEPEVIVDPNTLREDGTAALTGFECSRDGRRVACVVSQSGSDWQTIHVYDADARKELPERLDWCKFTGISWHPDGGGFYYTRFPEVDADALYGEANRYQKVFFHSLETAQAEDALVYERPDAPDLMFDPHVSDDGRYVYLIVTEGTDPRTRVYVREIDSAEPFLRVLDAYDAMYIPVGNDGPLFYVHTDRDGPRGRIVAVDIQKPEPLHWRELIPERSDVIDSVRIVGGQFVIVYQQDAHHLVQFFHLDGHPAGEIRLPAVGSVLGHSGKPESNELLFGFTSFLYPSQPFRYDLATATLSAFQTVDASYDLSKYETRQVFFHSKDGTRAPLFLTHKRGIALDGSHPTLLYGYGGFNISLTPEFSVSRLAWLERGGVYAVANLRGGSEYGEEWHKDGMLHRKQNVFDDFIAAAEWLIDQGYTRSSRLGIMGGSNGGLLVAACMLQRPDLYGAVVCQVPVTDMLRYHKFTAGRFWTSEYGNAETSREAFRTVYAYSPLHNVRLGAVYPPILITTGDTDDRVVPLHAMKFTATLQAAAAQGANPILLRVETSAGHGVGKPASKVIAEAADLYAFLLTVLDRAESV
ncbi:MAG: prolyl oligopeptidase family serine peptidase [Bacilli bacterium]